MNLLVTTEALAQHLRDSDWIVFDARHDLMDTALGPREYSLGHIPGAIFRHIDKDLSAPKNGRNGRHPLPTQVEFAAQMADLGATPDMQFVIYDGAGGMYASRLWWMLRWIGAKHVALLDGGYPKWLAEGRELSREVPQRVAVASEFAPVAGMTVDAEFVAAHAQDKACVLMDARAAERFRGDVEPLDPVAGHIPGAVNRFWQKNLSPQGTFKSASELHREYSQWLGGRSPECLINQCGSGVTACHNQFALELAGLAGSKLYPGSWSEWVADPARPVALGAA